MAEPALGLARSSTPDPQRVQRLEQLVARVTRWWLQRIAIEAWLRSCLACAVPALALALVWPPASAWIFGTAAGVAVLCTAGTTWAAYRRGPPFAQMPTVLRHEVGERDWSVAADELATWLECQHRSLAPGWLAWLERSLEQRLPRLEAQPLQPATARPLGRMRWLLWPAILLALAWLWLQCFAPAWRGLLGGAAPDEPPPPPPPPLPAAAAGQSDDKAAATGPGDSAPTLTVEPRPTAGNPPPPPPPRAPASEPPPEPPAPPAPLLDLPGKRQFVVPDHIADGPTTRQRMHVAETPDPGDAAPAGAPAQPQATPTPPATALREEFARAAEAAQQARHVPDAERPLVQRYFRLLREAAR
jgi:hypothetical protein